MGRREPHTRKTTPPQIRHTHDMRVHIRVHAHTTRRPSLYRPRSPPFRSADVTSFLSCSRHDPRDSNCIQSDLLQPQLLAGVRGGPLQRTCGSALHAIELARGRQRAQARRLVRHFRGPPISGACERTAAS
jgi:hypothetical protein